MQAWRIEATSDGHVRWIRSTVERGRVDHQPPSDETLGCSMEDLLLQAWPKITGEEYASGKEEEDKLRGYEDQCTTFSTGLGRSVLTSRSSAEKAKSVLEVNEDGGSGHCNGEYPMFQTGLGRPVSLEQSSVEKACALLGNRSIENTSRDGGQFQLFKTGSGRPVSVNKKSVDKARALLEKQKIEEEIEAGGPGDQLPLFDTGCGGTLSVDDAGTTYQNQKCEEGYGDGGEQIPIFKTGSGRPVSVNLSSIQKARAFLDNHINDEEHEDVPIFSTPRSGESALVNHSTVQKPTAALDIYNNGEVNGDVQMFSTGSGRPVSVNQRSMEKAKAVLQNHNNDEECGVRPIFSTGLGGSISVSTSSIQRAQTILENNKNDEVHGDVPMFATGSGRPVSVKKSSLQKAKAVLDSHNDEAHEDIPMFSTGSDWPVLVNKSSIHMAQSLLENYNNGHGDITSATRPGQPVYMKQSLVNAANTALENVDGEELHREHQLTENDIFASVEKDFEKNRKLPSDGISRAKNLLGLDENDLSATQLFNHAKKDQCNFLLPENQLHPDACRGQQGLSTAGGRPITLSKDALTRARNLLGNLRSEDEIILNEERMDREITPRSLELDFHRVGESRVAQGPEKEVPHQIGRDYGDGKVDAFASKRKPRKISSVTPFKRPRNSRFIAPLNRNVLLASDGSSSTTKLQNGCLKERVSTRYPFHLQRKAIREFFGGPPLHRNLDNVSVEVKQINANNADKFVFKNGGLGFDRVGSDECHALLIQSGALSGQATKQWVTNHYKWIVWKLACYERCYPSIAAGKFLTASNVLEELKYRYEREVNYGHRSAIKKILDGDVSPASVMVLCVCNINSSINPSLLKLDDKINDLSRRDPIGNDATTSPNAKIKLTDGWYSIDASLDALLTKQLLSKKIFIGQKIRISGASLCGWVGPISFLEASGTVSLSLHINGTYRASWDEPIGLCKRIGPPLAFWCIRNSGGTIPLTLLGIKKMYPLLYRERLSNGGYVVRSERREIKALQLYHQRRTNLAEEITLKSQEICSDPTLNETCEGAQIAKQIERSAEPEVLMAGMTSEQLKTFSSYQAKKQDTRQRNLSKKIENALEQAGLGLRDVSPFMKVRVVGLHGKNFSRKSQNKEGLVTIWNPTEKHKMDLMEGGIYHVTGLVPLNHGGDILYLQARGSSSIWKPLSSVQANHFESFFVPRKAVQLSNLGQVPLASEFDIAAVVLLVGDVYLSGQQKRQWIFMTDGSGSKSEFGMETGEICKFIVAVSFFSPVTEDDCSSELFSKRLEGSTVGFLNLVKRARDQRKSIWVAEATDYSTYTLSTQLPNASHLKNVASSAEKWAKSSPLVMKKLRERVLCLVNGQEFQIL
ncbi:Breast cancer type 2 susceptibility protein-like protein [Rhynchospora pubera]|uniref:Breast cancer type 2 susceptibility protein-like protein n=1 Tax=Rhynchospora pubera TaxID=906938 RepID=A0AAV8EVN0_9POAL|nr:Breast cancer type 2 susceptibility protein-like protein [Rhynchospora pubera]